MIPVQLNLRNFLSYRDPVELELGGIHLACISGSNGAGKSTILDAITWVLFGKSRVKSDDDLVTRTEVAKGAMAEVSFVFELEGAIYRIIRRKAVGKSVELEFHARAANDATDRWQVRTEAKVKETQAEIEKLLRMNYDVFTNASFLLQGKADEFTTKTPDKRKEILAEILGVSQWDDYKDLVTERRKTAENETGSLERQLVEIEAELAQEEELTRALELVEAKATAATAERDRHEMLVASARQNKVMADQQRELLRRFITDLSESQREKERLDGSITQRRAEQAEYRKVLERREGIESNYREWATADTAYIRLQERAEAHTAIARQIHPIEMAIARAETQLEQRVKELQTQKEQATRAAADVANLTAHLAQFEAQLTGLQSQQDGFVEQEQAWQAAQSRLQEIDLTRRLWEQECVQLEARAREIGTYELQRNQFEASRSAAAEQVALLVNTLAEMAAKRERLAGIVAERSSLEGQQDSLKAEMEELVVTMAELESETDCPLCGQSMTDDHRRKVLATMQAQGSERGDQFRRNKAALESMAREEVELRADLKQQTKLEKDRDAHQAAATRYETRLHDIDKSLQAWRDGTETARIEELNRWLSDDSEKNELTARVEATRLAAQESRRLNSEVKQVEALIIRDSTRSEQLRRVMESWEAYGNLELADAQRRVAEKLYAEAERAPLAELQARLAGVGHDPAALEAARATRTRLASAPREQQELLQADAAMKPLADSVAEMEQQRGRAVARLAELQQQREQSERVLQELEVGVGDLPAAEAELLRLREDVVLANRAAGAARQKVEVLIVRREDRRRLKAAKTDLARRVGLLRQLEEACGRRGVQAMLIDAALPEIEDHANELLDRLTGGDMRIKFETQRASKSKQDGVIETLDIRISDGTGERPYENYSGGEKFRINFAVRLALSRVLAHRAGARLQTLVIDEGFGSQDPEGRQRLVEAINAVQHQFAAILVITHIDELRDKFPARIDVEKTNNGSRATLVAL